MFHVLKRSRRLVHFFNVLLENQRLLNVVRPCGCIVNYSSQIALCGAGQKKDVLVNNDQFRLIVSRDKHSGKKKKHNRKPKDEESSDEEDTDKDDDDDDDEEEFTEKGVDVKTYNVKTLRIDAVLKTVLRTSRKNIEVKLYENRIRLNGEKLHKKSLNVKVGDVIDVIKGVGANLNVLVVSQVKILKIKVDSDAEIIVIKASRCKSLEVENYQGGNAWREQEQEAGDSL